MKWIIAILALSGCSYERIPDRSLEMARFSFATGCYQAHMWECEGWDRYSCYSRGLKFCPIAANAFHDWLAKVPNQEETK